MMNAHIDASGWVAFAIFILALLGVWKLGDLIGGALK